MGCGKGKRKQRVKGHKIKNPKTPRKQSTPKRKNKKTSWYDHPINKI